MCPMSQGQVYMILGQELANPSVKGQIANTLGFVSHTVCLSVAATQLCHFIMKAAINNNLTEWA